MRTPHRLLSLLASLILGSCASTRNAGTGAGGPDFLSATLLDTRQVRSEFGLAYADNPFLFPTTFQTTDFIVVKLTARTSAKGSLSVLQSEATDGTGTVRATAYDRATFKQVAESMSTQVMDQSIRRNKIGWYYLPSTDLSLDPGQHEYVLVLGGTHPLPEGLTVILRVTLNGVEQDFTLGVPGKPK
jgi:hypothetical protein